jgi:hypothetical protein
MIKIPNFNFSLLGQVVQVPNYLSNLRILVCDQLV